MKTYQATYYHNGSEAPAKLLFLKDKLVLTIWTVNEPLDVYWYYNQIEKEPNISARYTYGEYLPQTLQVLSLELAEELDKKLAQTKKKERFKLRPLAKLFIAFFLIILFAYLFLIPWIAAALTKGFPISYEEKIGEQVYYSLQKDLSIDEEKTFIINEFYKELQFPSAYDVKISVVKSNVTNAFALPGGRIIVFDKIIDGMSSYTELAALLSHEFTHVEERHTLRSLFRQLGASAFLSLLVGDAGAVSAVLINNADNLRSLSYSRNLEKEADEKGLLMLTQRGIDCNGFIQLFQLLKKESGKEPSEWVSSHPNLNNRINNIKKDKNCSHSKPKKHPTLEALFLKLKEAK